MALVIPYRFPTLQDLFFVVFFVFFLLLQMAEVVILLSLYVPTALLNGFFSLSKIHSYVRIVVTVLDALLVK